MNTEPDRYSRQRRLPEVGRAGQDRLRASAVLLIGLGALGGVQAELLARAGVGRLRLVDRDVVDWHNLARQILYTEGDARAGRAKAEAAAEHLRAVNSEIVLEALPLDVTAGNIEALAADVDLVLDGADNFETRYLLNDFCVKHGKPWIYGGVLGTGGAAMAILPGQGPCLRCFQPEPPPAGGQPTCETAGVLSATVAVVAAWQVGLALRLLIGDPPPIRLRSFDPWQQTTQTVTPLKAVHCPCCGERKYPFLERRDADAATVLCGRNAVQVMPPAGAAFDGAALWARLEKIGSVQKQGALLRFQAEGEELIVFPDGRAVVLNTTDPQRARLLYSRYIGA